MITRSFSLLLFAVTISAIGSQFTILVLELTAVGELHATTVEMGLFTACASLAALVFGPLSGIAADRYAKRSIMIAADLFRLLVVGLCVALIHFVQIEMYQLIVVAVLVLIGDRFFATAFASHLPSVVGRDRLINAHGQLVIAESLSGVVGPAAGGLILTVFGTTVALLIDASTYLASMMAILAIGLVARRTALPEPPPPAPEPLRLALTKGFTHIAQAPTLRTLLIRGAVLSGFDGAFAAIVFIYYLRILRLDQFQIGLISSALALGLLVGGACTRYVSRAWGVGRGIVLSNVLMAAIWIPLPFLPAQPSVSVPVLACIYVGYGILLAIASVNGTALRQARTPDALLGRVEAAYGTAILCAHACGALAMGLVAASVAVRTAIGGLALLAVLAALLGLSSRRLLAVRDVSDGESA